MNRRHFFQAGMGALVAANFRKLFAKISDNRQLPRRPFNDKTELSIIGFGGIVVVGMEQADANTIVRSSIDSGVNYFDVAPSYWDGEAEKKLGIALEGVRNQNFLACKTMARDAEGAREELETSLKRLRTDYFDLYQFHAVTSSSDVESIFAPNGALKTFLRAREDGKIRYIGFSAHSEEAALTMLDRFEFDSILFPVNFVCYFKGDFGPAVMQKAREKNVTCLALKAMAHTPLTEEKERKWEKCWYQPVEENELAEKALRFTLSEGVAAAIPPGEVYFYQQALSFGKKYRPLDDAERDYLKSVAGDLDPLFPL